MSHSHPPARHPSAPDGDSRAAGVGNHGSGGPGATATTTAGSPGEAGHGPAGERVHRGHVTAWAVWDWGAAAFNAVMVTFVFGTYLASDAFGDADRGTQWLTAANAVGGAIIALTAPVIGQRADRGGRRRLWLGVTTGMVVVLTALCFFVQPQESYLLLGVILLAAGNVVFEFAEVNYNAMLLQIATNRTIGKISGFGWGAGYVGGIFLLLILYVGFIGGDTHWFGVTEENALNIRVVALFAAAWFLVFSLPVLLAVPESPARGHERQGSIVQSYVRLWRTIVGLWREDRNTFWFLVASAVFRDGVGAVFTYGAILGVAAYGVAAADILVFGIAANVVAAAGAFLGGWVDDRIGPKRVILGSLAGLIVAAASIFFLSEPTDWNLLGLEFTLAPITAFWIFGLALCFFVGPVQSASRSFLGRLARPEQAGELYGLYATTGRSVSFLAPALISAAVAITGDSRFMIPAILLVLLAGAALLLPVRDPQPEQAHRDD